MSRTLVEGCGPKGMPWALLGLSLLVAFSAGLAVVLTAIGLAVLYAKQWLPDSRTPARGKALRYLPVASAAFIVCVGVAMTWVSLRPPR